MLPETEVQLQRQYRSPEDPLVEGIPPEYWEEEEERFIWTCRSRSLTRYSSYFNYLGRTKENEPFIQGGLWSIIQRIAEDKGKVHWIDAGCGNGIPQRQGMKRSIDEGIDLIPIGYDVLPFDEEEYWFRRRERPNEFFDDDLNPKYTPRILLDDIRTAQFPFEPDLVTCYHVWNWSDYPLEIFSNIARQIPSGAWLVMTDLGRFLDFGDTDSYFFKERKNRFLGFVDPSGKTYSAGFEILRRTNEKVDDFMYGYSRVRSYPHYSRMSECYDGMIDTIYKKQSS